MAWHDETTCKMIPYEDTYYDYYCLAPPTTGLTEAAWRIRRVSKTTDQVDFADDNPDFVHTATSLAVVQGHFA